MALVLIGYALGSQAPLALEAALALLAAAVALLLVGGGNGGGGVE